MTIVVPALRAAVAPAPWVKNELWRKAREVPSLDLRFAEDKSLVDATTGSNLVDFTRASSGTYVGSDGLIKTATTNEPRFDHDPTTGESLGLLVEESRTNLLTYSEDFSQADWTQNTNVTLTASDVAAPDGTFTATTASNPTTGLSRVGLTVTGTATTNYVGSIWARRRSGTGDTFLRVAENNPQAISLTTEWQRIWATDESTTTLIRFYIDFYDTGNAIDIWGAQLEEGSFPTSYIPTTTATVTRAADVASISGSNFNTSQFARASTATFYNSSGIITTANVDIPRNNYNPTTLVAEGLLLEPQRQNLLLQSEAFDTTWTLEELLAFGSGSTADTTTAPDGNSTADLITENSNTGIHSVTQSGLNFVAGKTYTFSCFVKQAVGSRNAGLQMRAAVFDSAIRINLDFATGDFTTAGSPQSSSAVALPNGWWRISITATAVNTATSFVDIAILDNVTLSYTGDGTSGIYVWGAQLEEGPDATSYIPTTTTQVTRSADVPAVSPWYRQDEGTVFYEGQVLGSDQSTSLQDMLGLSDGTIDEFAKMFIPIGSNQRFRVDVGGVTQVLQNTISTDVYSPVKAAFALKLNNTTSAGNGIVQPEDTSCLIPAVDRFVFGTPSTGESQLAARYKRLTYWPQRLSNDTLQTITQ